MYIVATLLHINLWVSRSIVKKLFVFFFFPQPPFCPNKAMSTWEVNSILNQNLFTYFVWSPYHRHPFSPYNNHHISTNYNRVTIINARPFVFTHLDVRTFCLQVSARVCVRVRLTHIPIPTVQFILSHNGAHVIKVWEASSVCPDGQPLLSLGLFPIHFHTSNPSTHTHHHEDVPKHTYIFMATVCSTCVQDCVCVL